MQDRVCGVPVDARPGRPPAARPVRNGRPAFFSVLPGISRPRSGPGGDGQASHLFYGSRRGGDRRRPGGPPPPGTVRRGPTEGVRPSPCGDSVSFGGRVPPIRREEGGGRLSRFGRVGTGPVGLPEVRQSGKQVLPFRRLGRKTPLRSLGGKGRP